MHKFIYYNTVIKERERRNIEIKNIKSMQSVLGGIYWFYQCFGSVSGNVDMVPGSAKN